LVDNGNDRNLLRLLLSSNNSDSTTLVSDKLGSHVETASSSTLESKLDPLFLGAVGSEQTKSDISVTKGFTLKQVLVTDLDVNIFVKLIQLLNRDVHMLHVPLRVLTAILADIRSPFLFLANPDPNEGILLVEWTTTVNL
jgi:hypothetical protein